MTYVYACLFICYRKSRFFYTRNEPFAKFINVHGTYSVIIARITAVGTGINGSFGHVVENFFEDIFNHDYGVALNAIRDNLKQYNFEATFNYTNEDYSTDYLSHETIKLMWKDQHTEIIETTQMDDECSVENLFELNLYSVGDIYSADWLIKHYDEWCNSFTGMDNYREHKREMIDLLKTHPQPLRIYSQFEEMMSEIPSGLELVNRLDK